MFCFAVLLALLACIDISSADLFTIKASLPGSTLDGLPVNAAGQAFWLGGSPASYCPTVVPHCPNVTETIFAGGLTELFVSVFSIVPSAMLTSFQVEVPGGQGVYVNVNGALGFTQAHSIYVPTGAYFGGFFNLTILSDCSPPRTVISWKSPDRSTGMFSGALSSMTVLKKSRRYLYLPDRAFLHFKHYFVPSLHQDTTIQLDKLCLPGRFHCHILAV